MPSPKESAVIEMQEYSYELGSYQGRTYHLRVRESSNSTGGSTFATVVYYRDADARETEVIARVDDAHGYSHFDRLYRRDQQKDRVDWGPWEAADHFFERWRQYAERYEDAWGDSSN